MIDEDEEIKICLNCKKSECNNCLGKNKKTDRHYVSNRILTDEEIQTILNPAMTFRELQKLLRVSNFTISRVRREYRYMLKENQKGGLKMTDEHIKDLYRNNDDFHNYVDRFIRKNPDYTIEKALRLKIIQEVAKEYDEKGVNHKSRINDVNVI